MVAGTSRVGLRSKKPDGLSVKPHVSTGMTGQSSGRGKCVAPNVCQSTMSCPAMSRPCATNVGSPAPPGCWLIWSPAGYRSAGSYRVTHRCRVAKAGRRVVRADRHPARVQFLDRVGDAVEHHVQPHVEQMLVVGTAEP